MHPKNIFDKVSFFRTNTPNLRVHFRPRSRVPNLCAEFRNAKPRYHDLVAAMEIHGHEIAGPACNSVSNRSKYVYELLHKEREPCGEITAYTQIRKAQGLP